MLTEKTSSLSPFQRTRGMLRLLARTVHRVWENQANSHRFMGAEASFLAPFRFPPRRPLPTVNVMLLSKTYREKYWGPYRFPWQVSRVPRRDHQSIIPSWFKRARTRNHRANVMAAMRDPSVDYGCLVLPERRRGWHRFDWY